MRILQWSKRLAIIAGISISALQTEAAEAVSVTVQQTHDPVESGETGKVTDDIVWWVELDDDSNTATIVAPPTDATEGAADGKYVFPFTGRAGKYSPSLNRYQFWTSSITGMSVENAHFTALRIPAEVEVAGVIYTVTAIGPRAFAGSNIVVAHMPETVTSIGEEAFAGAESLMGIGVASAYELIPNSVTEIGARAFSGCTAIDRIDIGDGVTTLPEGLFDGCTALRQLKVGAAVTDIECDIEGLDRVAFHSPVPPTGIDRIKAAEIWVPEEYKDLYATALTASEIHTFGITPELSGEMEPGVLKYYVNQNRQIKFHMTTAPWIPKVLKENGDPDNPADWIDDTAEYYFIYRVLRNSGLAQAEVGEIMIGSKLKEGGDPDDPDDYVDTHVPYMLKFSVPQVVRVNATNQESVRDTMFYAQYLAAGQYELTLISNDVTRASYTWQVNVEEGVPTERFAVTGKATMAPGDKQTLTCTAVASPESLTPTMSDHTWRSGDETVATVDPATGEVTAIADGLVNIYAYSLDPATPEAMGWFTIRVNSGTAVPWDHNSIMATSTDVTGETVPYKTVTDQIWMFFNEDGTYTLTYPHATLDDDINDYANFEHYTFNHSGFDALTSGGDLRLEYGIGLDSWTMQGGLTDAQKNRAFAHNTSFEPPLNIYTTVEGTDAGASIYFLTKIDKFAFAGSNIRVINLRDISGNAATRPITEIGDYAFRDCEQFIGIPEGSLFEVIPDEVTKIGKGLFWGCVNMERMIIGDGVEEIPERTFDGCSNLKEVYIGKSVKRIYCSIPARRRIAFGSPEPPELIGQDVLLNTAELWVPEEGLAAYQAKFPDWIIHPYSMTINEGQAFGASVGQKRTVSVDLKAAPLQNDCNYLYPYHKDKNSVSYYKYNNNAERPRFAVDYDGGTQMGMIRPYNNRLEFQYNEARSNKEFTFRSLDITRQRVTVKYSVKNGTEVSNIIILGKSQSLPPESLTPGASDRLYAYINTKQSNEVEWSSSDPDVVSIDANGNITAVGYGSAVISAKSTSIYSDSKTAQFTITVKREGEATVWTSSQRHVDNPEHTMIYTPQLTTTMQQWWFHVNSADGTASLAFPHSTPYDITKVENGAMPDEPYQFDWAGWDAYLLVPGGAYSWHDQLPEQFRSRYFTAVELPLYAYSGLDIRSITAIGAGAFAGSNISVLHVHELVTKIGDYAFANCPDFIGLSTRGDYQIVSNFVTEIGKGIFKNCVKMKKMVIGDGVTVVPEETFDGCSALSEVGIGKSVKEIRCNIAASEIIPAAEEGGEPTLKLKPVSKLAFRSITPPKLADGVKILASEVYVPWETYELYRLAWADLNLNIKPYRLNFDEENIVCYANQERKIDFTKSTAQQGATTFYFIYPTEHQEGEMSYAPSVNAYPGHALHGEWYIIRHGDISKVYSSNKVQGSFMYVTYNSACENTLTIEAYDVTRASATVNVTVKEGVWVSKILMEGVPAISPGSSSKFKATALGPADPDDPTKNLTPSDPGIVWSTSDENIATVDPDGTVHGLSVGYVYIYAKSTDPACSDKMASKRIYIGEKFTEMGMFIANEDGSKGRQVAQDLGIFAYPGESVKVIAEAYPDALGVASFQWSTAPGSEEFYTFDPATLTFNMIKEGRSSIKVTIPAAEAEGDLPLEFYWPVTTKTKMTEIEVTQPGEDGEDDKELGEDNPVTDYTGVEVPVNVTIDENATDRYVTWTSSDPDIVDIKQEEETDGTDTDDAPVPALLSARATPDCQATLVLKKRGHALVTASDPDGRGAVFTFPVEVKQQATDLTLYSGDRALANTSIISGHPNNTASVRPQISPDNANINDEPADRQMIYTSQHESVATVNPDGTINFIGIGRTVITATVADGSDVKRYFTVNVTSQPVAGLSFPVDKMTGHPGEKITLEPEFTPADATDQRVAWTSSDRNVATVTSDGVVTLLKPGTVTITATSTSDRSFKATLTIEVTLQKVEGITFDNSSYSGVAGDEFTITATVTPADATDPGLVWSSSDPEVATVDENGHVKLIAEGEATITAETTDGSGIKQSCTVTVNAQTGPEKPDQPDDPVTPPVDPVDPEDPEEPVKPVDPVEPDDPSSINSATAGSDVIVRTEGLDIIVEGAAAGSEVRVFSTAGALVAQRRSDGSAMRFAIGRRGVYIVVAGKVYKVSI